MYIMELRVIRLMACSECSGDRVSVGAVPSLIAGSSKWPVGPELGCNGGGSKPLNGLCFGAWSSSSNLLQLAEDGIVFIKPKDEER